MQHPTRILSRHDDLGLGRILSAAVDRFSIRSSAALWLAHPYQSLRFHQKLLAAFRAIPDTQVDLRLRLFGTLLRPKAHAGVLVTTTWIGMRYISVGDLISSSKAHACWWINPIIYMIVLIHLLGGRWFICIEVGLAKFWSLRVIWIADGTDEVELYSPLWFIWILDGIDVMWL